MFAVVGHHPREDGEGLADVLAEGLGADGNGRGKANRDRGEAGAESDPRMVDAGEKIIFAAGPGQCRGQFRVAERATKREDAADNPEHNERKDTVAEEGSAVGRKSDDLEAERGENAGADHVGDDESGCGPGRDGLFGGRRFHGEPEKLDAGRVARIQSTLAKKPVCDIISEWNLV